jgi:hypothetical protein
MFNFVNRVVKKLKKLDEEIINQYEKDDVYILCTKMMILICEEKTKILKIFFHAGARPDESAQITLDLQTIKGIKHVYVSDVFLYVDNMENVITGYKAFDIFENNIKQNILDEFIKEQNELHYLMNCQIDSVC